MRESTDKLYRELCEKDGLAPYIEKLEKLKADIQTKQGELAGVQTNIDRQNVEYMDLCSKTENLRAELAALEQEKDQGITLTVTRETPPAPPAGSSLSFSPISVPSETDLSHLPDITF